MSCLYYGQSVSPPVPLLDCGHIVQQKVEMGTWLNWLEIPAVCGKCGVLHFGSPFPALVVGKGKVLPYSLPSVGSAADPGVQAVNQQVTKPSAWW